MHSLSRALEMTVTKWCAISGINSRVRLCSDNDSVYQPGIIYWFMWFYVLSDEQGTKNSRAEAEVVVYASTITALTCLEEVLESGNTTMK